MCEVSNTVNIKNVVSNLKDNPVFHMSLASKELFHSNMLAWFLESRDSEDPLLSDIAKELAKLFMPDYTVLTVLREKSHLDLIIVFLPDNEDFKSHDWTEIEDVFQNSGSDDQDLLEKLQKNCRFVVVENKFKSIPDKEQLKKYNKTIEKRIYFKKIKRTKISVDLNEENTTRYLMAPEVALENFKECDEWKRISWDEISKKLSEALKTKEKRDPFTAKFIEHYANLLDNMLELTKDIEKKLDLPTNLAFPKQRDIAELSKIRIHDFYEKLWFSVLLSKIEITDEDKMELLKGSGYTRSLGLLDFKIIDAKEQHVWRGVQIQASQLRITLEPEWQIRKTDPKYVLKKDSDKKIQDYCDCVLEIMREKLGTNLQFSLKHNSKELHRFGEFKYRYIPLEKNKKISIEDLKKMINSALYAIYHLPLEDLEAEDSTKQGNDADASGI